MECVKSCEDCPLIEYLRDPESEGCDHKFEDCQYNEANAKEYDCCQTCAPKRSFNAGKIDEHQLTVWCDNCPLIDEL